MDSTSTDPQQQSQKQQQQHPQQQQPQQPQSHPQQSQSQQQQPQQPPPIHHIQQQYHTPVHQMPGWNAQPVPNQSRPQFHPSQQHYAVSYYPAQYPGYQYPPPYTMGPPYNVVQQPLPSVTAQIKPPGQLKPPREKTILSFIDPGTGKPVELPNKQQKTPIKNNNNNNNNSTGSGSDSTLASTNSATITTSITATNNTTAPGKNNSGVAQVFLKAATPDELANPQQSSTKNNNNNNNSNPTLSSASTTTATNATTPNQTSDETVRTLLIAASEGEPASQQKSSQTTDSSKSTAGVSSSKTKQNDLNAKEVKENGKGSAKDTDDSSGNDDEEVSQRTDLRKQSDSNTNETTNVVENKVPKDIVPTSDEVKVDTTEAVTTTTTTATTTTNKSLDEASEEDKQQEESSENKVPVIEEPSIATKLEYEPDQYNPITNRSGKKKYSPEFLRAIGETVPAPKQDGTSEKKDLFAPSWHTPARQDEFMRRQPYSGRNSAGQDKPRKIIQHSPSLNQEVELKTVSNPWKPSKEVKSDAPNDVAETETLKKKFRSILNKLTPNNFDNLAQSVRELNINTEAKLADVIDIVFAKALSEPGYCVLYGGMCSLLKKISAGTANFGNTLLKRCQHQFQADIYSDLNLDERKAKIEAEDDPEIKKQLSDELYEDMYRCRKRGLGLIKFIGELYKIEMLNDHIMLECVLRLLSDTSEESLECLCDLLVTVGEKLDQSRKSSADKDKKTSNRGGSKANAYTSSNKSAASVVAMGTRNAESIPINTLDQVFEQLHLIRKNEELPLSVRIRFKILDTCELRERDHWQSKKTKEANPKKLDEIREAHAEKLEQDKQKNANRRPDNRRLGHSGGSSNHISSLGNDVARGLHQSSSSHSIRESDSPGLSDTQKQVASFALKSITTGSSKTDPKLVPLRPTFGRYGAK